MCQVAAEACCGSIQRSKALTQAEMNRSAEGLDIARLIAEALTGQGFKAFVVDGSGDTVSSG
jgi:hypothetical protein